MPEIGNPSAIRQTATQAYTGTFTFACGSATYDARDVVGPASGGAAFELANMGPRGAEIMIDSAWLRIDNNQLVSTEGSYRIALFNAAPPSALADAGNFVLAAADRDAFLGFIDIGTPADQGDTLWVEANGIWKQVTLAGTSLFGYLITNVGYTSSVRTFKGGIKALLV
jgi:hypothetical protein